MTWASSSDVAVLSAERNSLILGSTLPIPRNERDEKLRQSAGFRTQLTWNVSWNHAGSASRRRAGFEHFFSEGLRQHVLVETQISHQSLQTSVFSSSSCRSRIGPR